MHAARWYRYSKCTEKKGQVIVTSQTLPLETVLNNALVLSVIGLCTQVDIKRVIDHNHPIAMPFTVVQNLFTQKSVLLSSGNSSNTFQNSAFLYMYSHPVNLIETPFCYFFYTCSCLFMLKLKVVDVEQWHTERSQRDLTNLHQK